MFIKKLVVYIFYTNYRFIHLILQRHFALVIGQYIHECPSYQIGKPTVDKHNKNSLLPFRLLFCNLSLIVELKYNLLLMSIIIINSVTNAYLRETVNVQRVFYLHRQQTA
ncbi:MAG: hypothetical protein EAY66_05630 [Sphingobacteriales bacterium]|nr:MAG: hypothetical protein EAY66_05630 [Sphingobacteriales bacterium]